MRKPKLFGRLLLYLAIIWPAASLALKTPAAEPQKIVLALYGGRPDLPANFVVDDIIRSTLEKELGSHLDFYAEFLDAQRWSEGETESAVHDYLRHRYAQKRPSVIIAVAQPAISFMRLYGDELFPGVPVVAFGALEMLRDWDPRRPIAGALSKIEIKGTLELALRLQPRTREVLLISGVSPSDQWFQSLARKQLTELENRVKITYVNNITLDDLEKTVATIPDGTVIQFLSMAQDAAGNNLLSDEVVSRIAEKARVPTYAHGGIYLGRGTVGGVVTNPEALAHETAQLTLRVLQGERIQGVAIQESRSTVPMVDWRQLRRWGISEERLPAGTVVRFREPSVWDSYKWYIISGISLIILEAALITALLWQRTRRRKAEAELAAALVVAQESEQRFRRVANTAPVMIWMSGTDKLFTYVNQPWLDFTNRSLAQELGNGWLENIHGEDVAACFETYTEAFDRREPFTMQYRLRRHDGEYRWVLDRGIPRFDGNNSFAGYIGSCVDITDRKLAEEALSSVSRRLIDAQEQERTRIARELHDDINQRIAMVGIELDVLQQSLPTSGAVVRNRFEQLRHLTADIGAEIQGISHRLHSSKLEYLGLVAACKSFCREAADWHKVEVDFAAENISPALPQDISLCLFRVLQESLNNAIKHSGAQRFEARLRGTSDEIHLAVRDHGMGFDPAAAMISRGLGLISMRERVSLVKGTMLIASKLMGGTEITVRVPLVEKIVTQIASGAA
ncbi:MAG TPA: PAS domain S-box protein [Terriglobales bacterium]|jgi:PAS domain S-box-containing protein|nr:PAS domain S-box protein [Terriglobales bacterium]